MNPSLLTVVSIPSKSKKPPLMMDNIAPPSWDCAPFLITSTRSLMWVDRGDTLRLGVRNCAPAILFREVVERVVSRGLEEDWGNVAQSAVEALDYLNFYNLPDPEILYGESFDLGGFDSISRVPVGWLPPTWGVLVPSNRDYVGTAYDFGGGNVAALVHNPSRAIVTVRQ